MGWGLAIASFIATMAGSEIARREHQRVIKKKEGQAIFGIEERRRKADRELPVLFQKAADDVGTEKEKQLFNAEDVKNLATIKQTKARMTPDLTRGLQTGGKQSGRFTKLRADRFGKARERSDLADQSFARFLSPNRVSQIRGQAPIDVAFGRAKPADETLALKHINDMRIAGIQPNSGTLAFADALRVIGMMGSMYNMGSSLGAEAGAQAGGHAGTVMPEAASASSGSGLTSALGGGGDYAGVAQASGSFAPVSNAAMTSSFVSPLTYGTSFDPFMATQTTPFAGGGNYLSSWGAPPYENMFSDIYSNNNTFSNMFTGR